jgi:hypothetical protein
VRYIGVQCPPLRDRDSNADINAIFRKHRHEQAVASELVSINSGHNPTPDQYRNLANIPPELEWLANIQPENAALL